MPSISRGARGESAIIPGIKTRIHKNPVNQFVSSYVLPQVYGYTDIKNLSISGHICMIGFIIINSLRASSNCNWSILVLDKHKKQFWDLTKPNKCFKKPFKTIV